MDMNQTSQSQFIKMTQTPVPKLIVSLAIPTIVSMLITAIYNIADTFFVSQLGTSAAGAVGVVFSLMAIIQAVGFTIGMGAGSNISRLLGKKDYAQADEVGSSAFFTALFFGSLVTFFGLLCLHPFMRILGSTPTILPYAQDYARYILFGAPIMCGSFVLNNILRSEGKATLAMFGIATGGILNIILDPIFIFGFQLGISGAAIATLLSQCISFSILLSCFLRKKSAIHLHLRYISHHFFIYRKIIATGFPSFSRQGLASIATAILNLHAAMYGDAAVAAMSIVSRVFMLVFSSMLGFGQGFQPVAGQNYGAGNYKRVKEAILFSMKAGTIMMVVLASIGYLAAPQILTLFRRNDADVIAIGTLAMRAQCMVMPLLPLSTITNMTFQVLGHSGKATLLSSARQGLFFLPLILLLPRIIGLTGVQLTQPIADALTFIISILFILPFLKELTLKEHTASVDKTTMLYYNEHCSVRKEN
ncbi:MAG: MATE family efflux transporter [Lachnospiraceae bacterium]